MVELEFNSRFIRVEAPVGYIEHPTPVILIKTSDYHRDDAVQQSWRGDRQINGVSKGNQYESEKSRTTLL